MTVENVGTSSKSNPFSKIFNKLLYSKLSNVDALKHAASILDESYLWVRSNILIDFDSSHHLAISVNPKDRENKKDYIIYLNNRLK